MELVKDGNVFALPDNLTSIDVGSIDFRTKQEPRAGTHGAAEIGDGKVDKRTVSIDVHVLGRSIADHDFQQAALMEALSRPDQQLFIRPDRYMKLSRIDKVTQKYLKGRQFLQSQIIATLIVIDPFWYSVNLVLESTVITGAARTLTVNNLGNVDTPLIVTVAAAADCSAVTVTNETDSGRQFSLADVQLASGQTAVVNGALGTVYRGSGNTINTFSGSFLSLLPGENTITYTGGNCTLTLGYTPRWL